MEQDRIEMRFCGFGGQGVVLGSIIYGTALAKEGFNVIQSQVYGIEARGGASSGEVIYSDKPPSFTCNSSRCIIGYVSKSSR